MGNEPKQQELDFLIVFTDKEWEIRCRDIKHLYIFKGSIGEKLPQFIIGEISKVQCPFCNIGCLKLIEIEPQYGGGLRGRFGTQHHVGNDHKYGCTEEKCGAIFVYNVTWMYID